MPVSYTVMIVAAIIGLLVCPRDGQGAATNNAAATGLDSRVQCLNGSIGWSGECYNAAVITLNDETKLRDHCATDTELSTNLESMGCNSTVVDEIFRCLCPNVTSVTHGTPVPDTEDGLKELALFLIAHGLTQDCRSAMQPQVEQFQESLAKGCELLTTAKDLLVQAGMCTVLDIAKLNAVVCYVEPHKDSSTTLSP